MVGLHSFPSAFLDWLAWVSCRLEASESSAGESEGLAQTIEFAQELWRLRREFDVLDRSLEAMVLNGQLGSAQKARIRELLQDLRWLLQVSPSAPPALARQCVRIAQDRIAAEADELPGELPDSAGSTLRNFVAA